MQRDKPAWYGLMHPILHDCVSRDSSEAVVLGLAPTHFIAYTRKMISNQSGRRKANGESSPADSLLREAKALGDPTRYRIFRYIDEAKQPVYVDELTGLLHVNHNAVRQHLAVLKEACLVSEQLENRSKPGRPRLQYSANPQMSGAWGTEGPYQTVAVLMAEIIKTKRSAREVGRDCGKRRLQRSNWPKQSLLTVLNENLTKDGFNPRPSETDSGWDIVLQRCPFVEVAAIDPNTVCQLHLGLLEGLAQELDPVIDLSLTVRDPRRAGCRVKVKITNGTSPGA